MNLKRVSLILALFLTGCFSKSTVEVRAFKPGDCFVPKDDPKKERWERVAPDHQEQIQEVGKHSYRTLYHLNSVGNVFVENSLDFYIEDRYTKVECDDAFDGRFHDRESN
jgi:hypothetical protein